MNPYNGFPGEQRLRALAWLKRQNRPQVTECCACEQTQGRLMPHSEDYSEPFGDNIGEFGLCYLCHMMIHCRFYNRLAWAAYRDTIRSGKVFPPLSDFMDVKRIYLSQPPTSWPSARAVRESVDVTWLDTLSLYKVSPQTTLPWSEDLTKENPKRS